PAPAPPAAPEAEALILYTSGTTSGPKGVVLSRRALASRLEALRRAVPATSLERALCALPLHHGHGLIGGLLLPLTAGREVVLAPPLSSASAFDLGALVAESRATFATGVPALWRAALRLSAPPPRGLLRRLHSASSPLDADLRRELAEWSGGAEVVNVYGMTEAAAWVSGSEPGDGRPGAVGRGWGAELVVADEAADAPAPLPAGREGEVWVRADSLMSGYAGRPELTARVLRGGWYRTGDRGVAEPDGVLRLLGRRDDAINRAGVKVQPEEVEAALARHPDVAEACAFGVPHEIAGALVAAAVVWRPGARAGFADLERWCGERLAEAKVPRRWFALERLPRTATGKARRREVAALCARGEGGAASDAAPRRP
ncbi:MAG: long-chain fatty acid--CoA ligase, partial [Elusimicrobia bacterium]|nr:long-chain fatty acid--CoA ligase [Elusimicrobiota bacterium]